MSNKVNIFKAKPFATIISLGNKYP